MSMRPTSPERGLSGNPGRGRTSRLFLDTNVVIRFVTNDDPDQAGRACALFQRVEAGGVTLVTAEANVLEMVQVLSSKTLYDLPRAEVTSRLSIILKLQGLRVPNKASLLRALELWSTAPGSVDFVDVLDVAHMERLGISTIATFDRDFDRFPQIIRQDPG